MNTMYHHAANIPVFVTRRLRGCVEFLLVLLIWGVLLAIAATSIEVYIERSRVTEVFSFVPVIKQELTAMRAETGRWPAVVNIPVVGSQREGHNISKYIAKVEYEEGAFTVVFQRSNTTYRISFRAAVSESSPRSPVVWVCGYASPPAGYQVIAGNRSDIPIPYLPSSCRGEL